MTYYTPALSTSIHVKLMYGCKVYSTYIGITTHWACEWLDLILVRPGNGPIVENGPFNWGFYIIFWSGNIMAAGLPSWSHSQHLSPPPLPSLLPVMHMLNCQLEIIFTRIYCLFKLFIFLQVKWLFLLL